MKKVSEGRKARFTLDFIGWASKGSATNNTVAADTVAALAPALARFGTNLAPWVALRYDILQNVVTAALQMLVGLAGYFQSASFSQSAGKPVNRTKDGKRFENFAITFSKDSRHA